MENGISEFRELPVLMQIFISMVIVLKVLQSLYIEIQISEEINTLLFRHGQEVSIFPQLLWDQEMVDA